MKKIFHEFKISELPNLQNNSLAEINEALYKLYLEIVKFNGHKLICLIVGRDAASILVNLAGSQKELKDEQFYRMGYHGTLPIFVDASLGVGDILVVCKYGTEKIRLSAG